jgi:hypothetical protein
MTTLVSCSRIVNGDVLPVYTRSLAPRQKVRIFEQIYFYQVHDPFLSRR